MVKYAVPLILVKPILTMRQRNSALFLESRRKITGHFSCGVKTNHLLTIKYIDLEVSWSTTLSVMLAPSRNRVMTCWSTWWLQNVRTIF